MSSNRPADPRAERARARAVHTDGSEEPTELERSLQAAFDDSRDSLDMLQADHLDGSLHVPMGTGIAHWKG
jgi:hypothetical protein